MRSSNSARVLVTGGCGFIGRFTVSDLLEAGHHVVVLDDLSASESNAIPSHVPLYKCDLSNVDAITKCLLNEQITTVVHLAGVHSIPASKLDPISYYNLNSGETSRLLSSCLQANVKEVVFASTSLVYDAPNSGAIDESTPLHPTSPYARSKLTSEWILKDASAARDLRVCNLRYFNIAGGHPLGLAGRPRGSTPHLVKVLCEVGIGRRDKLRVFSQNHSTSDGTAVRDYVHVVDTARANRLAVEYLRNGGKTDDFNIASGIGTSIRELIELVEKITGRPIPVEFETAPPTEPTRIVGSFQKAARILGWKPSIGIEDLLRHAWLWELREASQSLSATRECENAGVHFIQNPIQSA